MIEWITKLDFSLLHWIQDTFQSGFLDFLMPKISFLGNAGVIWLLSAALLMFIPKYRRAGILLFIGLAAGFLCGNVIMKHLFARPRPCWIDITVPLLIPSPSDYSFPSGHTLSSVVAATLLTAADRRFGIVAIPMAALIAFSRLYLFVHFPTDVVTSVLLGLIIGFAVWKVGTRQQKKMQSNKNQK